MTDITLRSPTTEDELTAWYEPLSLAFGEEISPEEMAAERPMMDLARLINAFDGERRVGASGAFSMQLTVPGGAVVPASGITGVGVAPDARRRGVLRRMMDWHLADAIRRGEPLSILWASEAAIYQRFGFGMSTLVSSFEADMARLVFREPLPPNPKVRIRLVDQDEGARLGMAVYEQLRPLVPGSMARPEAVWQNMLMADGQWMRGGAGPKYRVVLEVDGEPRGFAVYRIKEDFSPRGANNSVVVIDLQALDPDAEQRLWQWLATMDLASTLSVRRGPVPHPLQLRLLEPRRLGLVVGDGLWLRLLDVPAALSARRYAGEGSVVLELTDDLLPDNAGRWEVRADTDGAAPVKRSRKSADLTLDIGALAAVYLGAWRFRDLANAGRLTASRPEAVFAADRLFATERAPYANTMF